MLLDDPLSALNGSVANHVYNSVIGWHGIMKGSCLLLEHGATKWRLHG